MTFKWEKEREKNRKEREEKGKEKRKNPKYIKAITIIKMKERKILSGIIMSDDEKGKRDETKYMGRILTAAQDRRFSTAMDIWAVILHSSVRYTYFNEEGKEINGLTAKDLAIRLNMTLSSVYHNLKLLRSEEINLLETNEVIDEITQRKTKQTVYSIPKKYEEEFLELYSGYKGK